MRIRGIEGMTDSEIDYELRQGGRFIHYSYCVSLLYVTFERHSSDVFFFRAGESTLLKGLPYTLLSLLAGWWGFPWGPIYTVQAIHSNFTGGEPADTALVTTLRQQATTMSPGSN